MESQAAAIERVRRAMKLVEQAQRLLEQAAQELSPVVGGQREWAMTGLLFDKAAALWSRLERLTEKPISL